MVIGSSLPKRTLGLNGNFDGRQHQASGGLLRVTNQQAVLWKLQLRDSKYRGSHLISLVPILNNVNMALGPFIP